jgi:predicted nucleic acid-binding protein
LTAYVDTSVLVAALTNETRSLDAQTWLGAQAAGDLMVSDWTFTEFSSALSVKLWTGALDVAQRSRVLAAFRRLVETSCEIATISGGAFRAAAGFTDQHALGLRAGDALHLAVAQEHGATLCTLDHRMASAGPALGVATHLL